MTVIAIGRLEKDVLAGCEQLRLPESWSALPACDRTVTFNAMVFKVTGTIAAHAYESLLDNTDYPNFLFMVLKDRSVADDVHNEKTCRFDTWVELFVESYAARGLRVDSDGAVMDLDTTANVMHLDTERSKTGTRGLGNVP